MTASALRERLALVRRTFGSLDEYARVRLQLLDAEAAEERPAPAPKRPIAIAPVPVRRDALPSPAAPSRCAPRPIVGGGVQLL